MGHYYYLVNNDTKRLLQLGKSFSTLRFSDIDNEDSFLTYVLDEFCDEVFSENRNQEILNYYTEFYKEISSFISGTTNLAVIIDSTDDLHFLKCLGYCESQDDPKYRWQENPDTWSVETLQMLDRYGVKDLPDYTWGETEETITRPSNSSPTKLSLEGVSLEVLDENLGEVACNPLSIPEKIRVFYSYKVKRVVLPADRKRESLMI